MALKTLERLDWPDQLQQKDQGMELPNMRYFNGVLSVGADKMVCSNKFRYSRVSGDPAGHRVKTCEKIRLKKPSISVADA